MVCSCEMSFNCFWLQILFCSCANETTLFSFLRSLLRANGRSLHFSKIFLKKQTRWSNDKTIIKHGYRKISWFVSVSQINYLPQPSASANNWSARHWEITIFCSTSSNNCWLIWVFLGRGQQFGHGTRRIIHLNSRLAKNENRLSRIWKITVYDPHATFLTSH